MRERFPTRPARIFPFGLFRVARCGDALRVAACAATLLARLPVEAQPNVLNPSSTARVAATETTRSLYEKVG